MNGIVIACSRQILDKFVKIEILIEKRVDRRRSRIQFDEHRWKKEKNAVSVVPILSRIYFYYRPRN